MLLIFFIYVVVFYFDGIDNKCICFKKFDFNYLYLFFEGKKKDYIIIKKYYVYLNIF